MLTGGKALDGKGWFVAPTLVDSLGPDARLAQEEVFGPIAVVLAVADEDEAVAVANGVPYGLVGSVFTRDLDRALGLAARLDTGMIRVNAPTSGVDFHAPFGGEKDSSFSAPASRARRPGSSTPRPGPSPSCPTGAERVAIWRLLVEGRPRLARGPAADGPAELLDAGATIDGVLGGDPGALAALLDAPAGDPVPDGAQLLAPVGTQPVWAAGVTFLRSRDARLEESRGLDAYDKVYLAERPELFLKALPGTARGPGQPIGVRADSDWDVPEPELALVADRRGQIVAYTIGNDVSSRSIEGENPLYLPQAKLYAGSCALGPCLVPVGEAPDPPPWRSPCPSNATAPACSATEQRSRT